MTLQVRDEKDITPCECSCEIIIHFLTYEVVHVHERTGSVLRGHRGITSYCSSGQSNNSSALT